MNRILLCCSMFMAAVLACNAARGDEQPPDPVRVGSRGELAEALSNAEPGTVILIAPGTYRGGFYQTNLQGTKEQPIVIAAADPEKPPVIEGGTSGMQLVSPQYIELRNLVIRRPEANGLNIDHGGDPDTLARHVTLTNIAVRDVPRGNRDGIKLTGIDDFRVENCTVERWGDSGSAVDMVACSKGVITGCTFRHDRADFASGVQAKGGSRDIIVRRCRFENAGGRAVNIGGSTGLEFFRPDSKDAEARDITVEDCTFIGSAAPIAFVGVDGATVQYNTIYRPTRWVFRILQETREPGFVACRNGTFANNLVVFRSDEIRTVANVGDATALETFTFRDNAWFCIDRPADTRELVELPVHETGGHYGVAPQFRAPDEGDLTVRAKALSSAGVRPELRGASIR